ncbi:MAG: hypothetical protein FJ125_03010 [Deltaproteobacteria bacterium]|nr:hypothetical protein [Deltaproteobacteria bacterium]
MQRVGPARSPDRRPGGPGLPAATGPLLCWLLPLLGVVLAYRSSPGFALIGDASFLIAENPWMRDPSRLGEMLTHDYFWSPAGVSIGYWRPLTKASWLVETLVGGGWPGLYHVVNVAWFAATVGGLMALGLQLGLPLPLASLAALLFGLHPAAVEPVCLVMARSDVACTAGLVFALLGWLRWRDGGKKRFLLLHLGGLLIGLASKEAAIVALPLLAAWVVLERLLTGRRWAWRSLAPSLLLGLLYLAARWALLGEGARTTFTLDPLRLLVGAGSCLRGVLPLALETHVRNVPLAEAASAGPILQGSAALLLVALFSAVCWARRRVVLLALLAWLLGSIALVLVADLRVPQAAGKIPLADRWLLQGAAASSLIGALLLREVPQLWLQRSIFALALLVSTYRVIIAPWQHAPYRNGLTLLDKEDKYYFAIPPEYREQRDKCLSIYRNYVRAITANDADLSVNLMDAMKSIPDCATSHQVRLSTLSFLVGQQRYAEARPIAEELAHRPIRDRHLFRQAYLIGATLLHTGDAAAAVPWLTRAVQGGLVDCPVLLALAQSHLASGAAELGAEGFEHVHRCLLGQGHPAAAEPLLIAAELWLGAGRPEQARRIVAELGRLALDAPLRRRLAELAGKL